MITNWKIVSIVMRNPAKASYSVLLVLALFSIFPVVPEIVKSFIALPALVLLPILFGNVLRCVIEKVWSRNSKDLFLHLGPIPSLIFEWFLGFYSIYALLFIFLLHTQNIFLTLAVTVVVCWIGTFRLDRERFIYSSTSINKRTILLLLALIIAGLIPISVIKYGTFPLPASRAFTVSGHLYRFVHHIAEHGIPDTPYDVVHPPSLNILYGLSSKMFSADPLSLLWSVPFMLLAILSIGMFLFTYELSGKRGLALMASIIGVWILSGTNAVNWPVAPEAAYVIYSLNPLIFYIFIRFSKMKWMKLRDILSSVILSLIFVLVLKYSISITTDYTANSPYIIFYQILIFSYLFATLLTLKIGCSFTFPFTIGLTLVAIHTLSGPLTLLVAAALFLLHRLNMKSGRGFTLAITLQLSLIVFIFLYISLQVLNIMEIPIYNVLSPLLGIKGGWSYTFDWKFTQLITGTSEFILVLFFLGMISLLLSKGRQNFTVATVAALVLLIYFLPEGFSFRAVDALAPFMVYAVASAIYMLKIDMRTVQLVATIILLAAMVTSIAPKTISLFTKGYLPNIDAGPTLPHDYEYKAALWIKENTPPNTVIISDPISMEILSSLADRFPLAQLSMGRTPRPEDKTRLDIVLRILKANKDSDIYALLSELKRMGITTDEFYRSFRPIEGMSFVILISSRTSIWIDIEGKYPIVYFNERPVRDRHVLTFMNSDVFKLVYKFKDLIYVFMPLCEAVLEVEDFTGDTGEPYYDYSLYLPFDEGKGSITRDMSWNGNNATVFGATWTDGKVGKGLSFDGLDDHVAINDSPSLSTTSAITVEAWVKVETAEKEQWIACKRNQYLLRIDPPPPIGNSAFNFFVMIDGKWEPRANSKIVPQLGRWYHVVGTYDGENVKIYVDGELRGRASRTGDIDVTDNPLWIGGVPWPFHGVIDEVYIYDRALSDLEVSSKYKGELKAIGRWASPLRHTSGYIVDIPYTFSSSKVEIYIKAAVGETSPDRWAFIFELHDETANRLVYSKEVNSSEFDKPQAYQNILVGPIADIIIAHQYALKIYFQSEVALAIDTIYIKGS